MIDASAAAERAPQPVSLRCPACGQNGTFESVGVADAWLSANQVGVGSRRCPNMRCRAHIFVVYDTIGQVSVSYPPEVIDFDSTNVPSNVVAALEEAITSHANECYVAAAIMVRKTLEELCGDRDATGDNLKERIKELGTKVVLPNELIEGLDDLRLLGNDAAHIESKVYDNVGREEVEVGIELAKEVLKGVYQMSDLLARLRGLKAKQEPSE
ncbi:MAG TPA: hypothetical protein DCP25_15560 [Chloroflexi bacterium]|jgi:hypothetical protein|nr:hypothetical protein [Chloroflexota bacterium]